MGILTANVQNGRADVNRLIETKKSISLDIGCGAHKMPGSNVVGMDAQDLPGVDIVHNWYKYPWPLPDECASFAQAVHVIEHVSPIDFSHRDGFGFIRWMNEVWRIMQPGGQFRLVYPNGSSPRFVQDPTHINPANEITPWYFCCDGWKHTGVDLYGIYSTITRPWRIGFNSQVGPAIFYDSWYGDVECLLIKVGENEIEQWRPG